MRLISNEELNGVAGGKEDGSSNWFSSLCNWMDGLGWQSGDVYQSVTITAKSWTDAEKIAYDISEGVALAPGCEFTYAVNPTSTTVGVTLVGSLTPSATGSASKTTVTAFKSWKCPALQ
jgi:hypothetical protein